MAARNKKKGHGKTTDGGKGKKDGKGKAKTNSSRQTSSALARDDEVYKAVVRLMGRAETRGTAGFGDRLRSLMQNADEGKKLNGGRAARKQQAKDRKQQQTFYDPPSWTEHEAAMPTQPSTTSKDSQEWSNKAATKSGKGKGDWQPDRSMKTISGTDAIKKLQDQQTLGDQVEAIVVKNQSQAVTLANLAKVSELQDKIAIVSPFDLGEGAGERDITCVRGDRRAVQKWNSVPLTSQGYPEAKSVRKQSTFQPPKRTLQTLRVMCVRTYMLPDMWRVLQNSPSEVCRLLGHKCHKTETWRYQGTGNEQVLTGYLTFETDVADQVLLLSGKNGIFVEALARDLRQKPLVRWQEPGEVGGVVYLQSVLRSAAGQPLAFRKGQGAAIGSRVPIGQKAEIACTWRVRGVPKQWSQEDLQQVLTGADFREVKILAEAQRGRPFLVRATDDTGSLALAVAAGDTNLQVERVLHRARGDGGADREWKPPTAKGKGKNKGQTQESGLASLGVASLSHGTAENMELDDEHSKVQALANPSGTTAASEAKASLKRGRNPGEEDGRAYKDSWEEVECGGEGHCFYNCISTGFILRTSSSTLQAMQESGTIPAKGRGWPAISKLTLTDSCHTFLPLPLTRPAPKGSKPGLALFKSRVDQLRQLGRNTWKLCTGQQDGRMRSLAGQPVRCWGLTWCWSSATLKSKSVNLQKYRPTTSMASIREVDQQRFTRPLRRQGDPGYIHDLCEDGDVEANPGPSLSSSRLQLVTWNAQGHGHIMTALCEGLLRGYDLVALQETNFTKSMAKQMTSLAEKNDYRIFPQG